MIYLLMVDSIFTVLFACSVVQKHSCLARVHRQFILNWGRQVFCGTVPFWHLIYHVPRVILKSTIVLHKSEIRTLLIFLNLIISIWKFYLSNFKDKIFCCCWGGGYHDENCTETDKSTMALLGSVYNCLHSKRIWICALL